MNTEYLNEIGINGIIGDTSYVSKVDTSNYSKVDTSDITNVDTSKVSNVDTSDLSNVDTLIKENHRNRLTKDELYNLILNYCEFEYKSIDEIAKNIQKDVKYLKNRVIPVMIESNLLVRLFPSTLNHPQQKYKKQE